MYRCIFKGFLAADAALNYIFPEYVFIITHMKQWCHPGCIQFIEFIDERDHLLQVDFYFLPFSGIKFKPGQLRQIIN